MRKLVEHFLLVGGNTMIIAVCTDDAEILQVAQRASAQNPGAFGNAYRVFGQNIPNVGLNEDLFIVAHGARNDPAAHEPVIGNADAGDATWLSAQNLVDNLRDIIPRGYDGSVYISACEVTQGGIAEFSFVELLPRPLRNLAGNEVVVFGDSNAAGDLPLPGDARWQRP